MKLTNCALKTKRREMKIIGVTHKWIMLKHKLREKYLKINYQDVITYS